MYKYTHPVQPVAYLQLTRKSEKPIMILFKHKDVNTDLSVLPRKVLQFWKTNFKIHFLLGSKTKCC